MQCVEFETRLNDLLDERHAPSLDTLLNEHADHCASCADLLSHHETLLEGVEALPKVRLSHDGRRAFAERVFSALTPMPIDSLSRIEEPTLVERSPTVQATSRSSAWAMVGFAIAAAAAILIAVLPWFGSGRDPAAPNQPSISIAEDNSGGNPPLPPTDIPWDNLGELHPIAWVGFQVADGLKPVTSSMVSALRELRKRPLFRGDDASGRSSLYIPRAENEFLA
jgi:hypothetical protein